MMSHQPQREAPEIDEDTLPSMEALREKVEVPDEWGVKNSVAEFAGYEVVAELTRNDKKQGILLADRCHSRIACVLVPVPEVASGYKIEASEAVEQADTIGEHLSDIGLKIQRREAKIESEN